MQLAGRTLEPAKYNPELKTVCALAVMTKAPRPGQVKTRLVPPLTQEEAAKLNACFLRDTVSAMQEACGSDAVGVAVYTPVGSEADYSDILPQQFQLIPQRGDDFGERLGLAVEDLFRCGFSAVCLIDSDSPTISGAVYTKAVDLLSQPDDRVVLGPSDDGGYYLIGMKENHRQLFERIDWSTERVFDQTRKRAQDLNLEVALLPNGYDVDEVSSLRRLCDELLSEKSGSNVAPQTRKFLAELTTKRRF